MEKLPASTIHLWLAVPETIREPRLLDSYAKLLSPEETQRQQRFHFPKHRHQFLVTRALIRTTLSRYTAVEPKDWRFVNNDYGRPRIAPDIAAQLPLPLQFNLSHTDGLIACAVACGRSIGVDVEYVERKSKTVDIADRFFSASECRELHSQPTDRQQDRFFDYWTLKESYIKARGMGLALPLAEFSFHLQDRDSIHISFGAGIHDDPRRWRFWLYNPSPEHRMALCVQRADGHDRIVTRTVIPLLAEEHRAPGC